MMTQGSNRAEEENTLQRWILDMTEPTLFIDDRMIISIQTSLTEVAIIALTAWNYNLRC
jgi:hypothetical protein